MDFSNLPDRTVAMFAKVGNADAIEELKARVKKYSPDQPRDDYGRFGSGDGSVSEHPVPKNDEVSGYNRVSATAPHVGLSAKAQEVASRIGPTENAHTTFSTDDKGVTTAVTTMSATYTGKDGQTYPMDMRITDTTWITPEWGDMSSSEIVVTVPNSSDLQNTTPAQSALFANRGSGTLDPTFQAPAFVQDNNYYVVTDIDSTQPRQGVATAMLEFARREADAPVFHTKDLTAEGKAFARVVKQMEVAKMAEKDNIRFSLFKALKGSWITSFEKNLELLKADDPIKKYSPDQPRDERGRFGSGDGGGGAEKPMNPVPSGGVQPATKGEFHVIDANSLGKVAKLSEKQIEDLSKSQHTGGASTATAYLTPDGHFTPEREALHDAIIAKYLDGLVPQENPTALFFGGGPGSGKTSVIGASGEMPVTNHFDEETNQIVTPEGATGVTINPDDLKLLLPGIEDARQNVIAGDKTAPISSVPTKESVAWADTAHEESSYLGQRLATAARERGLNVVMDTTGNNSVDKQGGKVNAFTEAGYTTIGKYVMVTADEGFSRAQSRAENSGRVVEEPMVRDTYNKLQGMLPNIGKFYDSYAVYSNMGDRNAPGKGEPIATQTKGGEFTVSNSAKYAEIMMGAKK